MLEVLGDVLPTALGLAISPIPIIATVLILLTPRARTGGVAYLLGTLLGIFAVTGVFSLIGGVLPEPGSGGSKPVLGVIQLLLGALAVAFAVVQWGKRPRDGVEPVVPKWMAGLEQLSVPAVFGMGLLLSALNPKNLILAANAGITVGAASVPVFEAVVLILIVVVIGSSTVLLPVLGNLIWGKQLRKPLERLQRELRRDNAVIMAVLMLVIGVQMIGKAIGHF